MKLINTLVAAVTVSLMFSTAFAHDTWLQTPASIVRIGEPTRVDLLLGNHGNDHRDFKIAGKVNPDDCTLTLSTPAGEQSDLKREMLDTGLTAKDGWWSARFTPEKAGLYVLTLTSDKVVDYAPKRSIKTAKAFVLATPSLDTPKVPSDNAYTTPVGRGLELVPVTHPVAPLSPGLKLKVKLLLNGQPLADRVVSFIPHGVTLKEDFDDRYERKTDSDGVVSFEFKEANVFLVAAHLEEKSDGKDAKYESIKYSATMTIHVPNTCECCE